MTNEQLEADLVSQAAWRDRMLQHQVAALNELRATRELLSQLVALGQIFGPGLAQAFEQHMAAQKLIADELAEMNSYEEEEEIDENGQRFSAGNEVLRNVGALAKKTG